jgi:hypothetical protein
LLLPLLSNIEVLDHDGKPVILGMYYNWWGKLSAGGKWLVKPRFHQLVYLGDGFYKAKYQGKVALFNEEGQFLTETIYEDLKDLVKRPDGSYLLTFRLDGKEGIMDGTGKVIIAPRFESITPGFNEKGHYIMNIDGKAGVLDLNDTWIIEPKYFNITFNEEDQMFWVMESVLLKDYYFHDLTGKRVGPIPKERIWKDVNDLPFKLVGCFQSEQQNKHGFCDPTGEMVIKAEYDDLTNFSPVGLALVKKGGKFGFIDPQGKVVVPIEYEDASGFAENGRAFVKKGGKWGIIDKTGKFIVEPNLDMAPVVIDERSYFVKKGGKFGLIDLDGKYLHDAELDNLRTFRESGYAWVQMGQLWGLIDHQGAWVLKPTYNYVGDYTSGHMAPALFEGRFAVIDENGGLIAHTAVECEREVILDKAGKPSWPENFSCQGGA